MSEREKYLKHNVFVVNCATQKKTRVVRHGLSDGARSEVKWSGPTNVVKRNTRTCIIFAVMKLMTNEISQNNKRQHKVQVKLMVHRHKVTARQRDTSRDSFIQILCTYMRMRRSGFVLSARIARAAATILSSAQHAGTGCDALVRLAVFGPCVRAATVLVKWTMCQWARSCERGERLFIAQSYTQRAPVSRATHRHAGNQNTLHTHSRLAHATDTAST